MSLFKDKRFAALWTILRIWVGYQWLEAGWHKLSDPGHLWIGEKAGTAIQGYWLRALASKIQNGALVSLTNPDGTPVKSAVNYSWYKSFLSFLVNTHSSVWFSYAVAFGELLVGVGLILGFATIAAAFFGALMNVSYMLAGTTSTNPVLYTLAILLILAGENAGWFGADRWLMPFVRSLFRRGQTGRAEAQA
ncbi:MAG TPA: DoxX family membrane protein [Bacillota bacterium]|jgi:thiosulfate dehydrogenase [quinone] large subunit